jgi:nicotinamidase/pyrazinamidase
MKIKCKINSNDVFLVVDVQNDFCSGTLAISGYKSIIPVINQMGLYFQHTVLSQDWHPADHVSFASQHPGKQPGDAIITHYGEQKLHRDHCVAGTEGAAFHTDLHLPSCEMILRKGRMRDVDSYSAFLENDRRTQTGLAGYLRERGVRRVFTAGLALYGCVAASALDAQAVGFETFLIDDAAQGTPNPIRDSLRTTELHDAGIRRILSADIVG